MLAIWRILRGPFGEGCFLARPLRLAAALSVLWALGGCLLSDQPLITTDDAEQPFNDYTILQERQHNNDTGQDVWGNRVSLSARGSYYCLKGIDSVTAYDNACFLIKALQGFGDDDLYALQTVKQANFDNKNEYIYFALYWSNANKQFYLKNFSAVTDCSNLNDDLLMESRAQSRAGEGCAVNSFAGLSAIIRGDVQNKNLGGNWEVFRVLRSAN